MATGEAQLSGTLQLSPPELVRKSGPKSDLPNQNLHLNSISQVIYMDINIG